jgi:hypothetical protein
MATTTCTKTDTILFRIVRIQTRGTVFYRATARIPGFGMAYVIKPEGDINFPNRSAALKACKRRAAFLGMNSKITSAVSKSQATAKSR